MFELRLNHVVAAARTGSFTAAAQAVGVTQSAITKSIAELERQLGYRIFHRTSRGAMLTEEGRVFVDRASRLLDDARHLLRNSRAADDPYAGVLRIGVAPASIEWLLVEPLAALAARYPRLVFDVSTASFERMAEQLRNGGVDVALGFDAAFSELPEFKREWMAPLRTTFFVRHGHPLLERDPVTIADLAQYEFVSPSDSRPYGAMIRDIYESQGVDAQTRIHVIDFFPIAKRIVATTNALGVIALPYTATESFKRRFSTVAYLESFPLAPLCCAIRARMDPKPTVRAFINICRQKLALGHDGADPLQAKGS